MRYRVIYPPECEGPYKVWPRSWYGLERYKSVTLETKYGDKWRWEQKSFVKVCVKRVARRAQSRLQSPIEVEDVAEIVEIRSCTSPEYVMLIVRWLYRPEDVPLHGRRTYHGCNEVISSNHFQFLSLKPDDIVPLRAIRGSVEVKDVTHELVDDASRVYHFRQQYNFSQRRLTEAGKVRTCKCLHDEHDKCPIPRHKEARYVWSVAKFSFK